MQTINTNVDLLLVTFSDSVSQMLQLKSAHSTNLQLSLTITKVVSKLPTCPVSRSSLTNTGTPGYQRGQGLMGVTSAMGTCKVQIWTKAIFRCSQTAEQDTR